MQAQIRNRSFCNRQLAVSRAAGIGAKENPSQVKSDKLYDPREERLLNGMNRKLPSPVFRKVHVPEAGVLIWSPCNERANIVLQNMTLDERVTFLLTANDPKRKVAPLPESKRVMFSKPVKATPRGSSEVDAFGPNVLMHAKEKPAAFKWQLAGNGIRDTTLRKRLTPTMLDHSVPRGRNQDVDRPLSNQIDVDKLAVLYAEARAQSPAISIATFIEGLTEKELDSVQVHPPVRLTGVSHPAYNPIQKHV